MYLYSRYARVRYGTVPYRTGTTVPFRTTRIHHWIYEAGRHTDVNALAFLVCMTVGEVIEIKSWNNVLILSIIGI